MNRINHEKLLDLEILKTLLPEQSRSIEKLQKEMKLELSQREKQRGDVKDSHIEGEILLSKEANYATVLRHAKRLNDDKYLEFKEGIRKDGTIDKRRTHNLLITNKGLVYLLLEGSDFTDTEIRKVINRILRPTNLQVMTILDALNVSVDVFRKTMNDLRFRVNLKFFNEEYVLKTLFNLLWENIEQRLDKFAARRNEELQSMSNKQRRKYVKEQRRIGYRDAKLIPETVLDFMRLEKEKLVEQRNSLNHQIGDIDEALEKFSSIRKGTESMKGKLS